MVDSSGTPVYLNDEARKILYYPEIPGNSHNSGKSLPRQVKAVLQRTTEDSQRISTKVFKSGRRRYLCRYFPISSVIRKKPWPMAIVLFERNSANKDVLLMSDKFNLTQREREAVLLLAHGLTSKEIANRMGISPNTVKAFLRLVMIKTDVTTRSGIVGKFLHP